MFPTSAPEERIRTLSLAVFANLEPTFSTLRLIDPRTDELCDYKLVRISKRPANQVIPLETQNSASPLCPSSARTDSWVDRHSAGSRVREPFHPLARLPPLAVRSRGDGTPSLFNDSRPSEVSTLSLAPTPVRQLFPGATIRSLRTPVDIQAIPNISGSLARVGLGFCGLLKDDGTPFDGLGSLPRRTSTPLPESTSPAESILEQRRGREIPDSANEGFIPVVSRPKSTPNPPASGTHSLLPPSAPLRRASSIRPASALPVRPEQDDVFLSRPIRVPGSLTRGLFRRASSAAGGKERWRGDGGARCTSAIGGAGGTRRFSAGWASIERERDGSEKRPVWRP